MLSPMVWSDKGMLRVIGCGCEGITSPHTEKDLHDPDPRAHGSGTRPGTNSLFVFHYVVQDKTPAPPGSRRARRATGTKRADQR